MKKSIVFLIVVLLSVFSVVNAQTSENQQRERDIKIAEEILSEIFGGEDSGDVVFPGFQNRSVRGEYIPGYGVHFTVSSASNFVSFRNLSSEENDVRIEIDRNGDQSRLDSDNEEEIKEKIFEYMTKYGSLISGVPDDETIRVTYTPNESGTSMTWIFVQDGERSKKSQPGISAWAKISDLKQFRNGNISEQQLRNRINTHTLDSDESFADLNIFASVLETALNDTGAEHLRVSRKPQMEYLPGLGVRYRIQVSTRPGFILNEIEIFDDNFEFRMDSLRLNLDESLKLMEESLNPLILKLDSVVDFDLSEEERERIQQEVKEHREEIQAQQDELRKPAPPSAPRYRSTADDSLDLDSEADAIMDQLLDVIENYGSTLTSLDDDEMLMISVNWTGRSDELPERTEVRIKKSELLRGELPDIEEIERR